MGQYIIDENGERVLVNPKPAGDPQEADPRAVDNQTVIEEHDDEHQS